MLGIGSAVLGLVTELDEMELSAASRTFSLSTLVGLPRLREQVDRRHAMPLRLSFYYHHDVPTAVYGAEKA